MLLTACTNATEVRDRRFVQTAGITLSDEAVSVSLGLFGDDTLGTGSGATVLEALDDAASRQSGSLFLGHTQLLIFTGGTGQPQLTELLQAGELSPGCSVLYSSRDPAGLLEAEDAGSLPELLEQQVQKGLLTELAACDILSDLLGKDGMAAVPCLTETGFSMALADRAGIQSVLDADACRGLALLQGTVKEAVLSVQQDASPVSVRIERSHASVSAQYDETGAPMLLLSLKLRAVRLDEESTPQGQDAVRQLILSFCEAAVEQTLRAGADVIGAEAALRRLDNELGNSSPEAWNTLLRTIPVQCDICVTDK